MYIIIPPQEEQDHETNKNIDDMQQDFQCSEWTQASSLWVEPLELAHRQGALVI